MAQTHVRNTVLLGSDGPDIELTRPSDTISGTMPFDMRGQMKSFEA